MYADAEGVFFDFHWLPFLLIPLISKLLRRTIYAYASIIDALGAMLNGKGNNLTSLGLGIDIW